MDGKAASVGSVGCMSTMAPGCTWGTTRRTMTSGAGRRQATVSMVHMTVQRPEPAAMRDRKGVVEGGSDEGAGGLTCNEIRKGRHGGRSSKYRNAAEGAGYHHA